MHVLPPVLRDSLDVAELKKHRSGVNLKHNFSPYQPLPVRREQRFQNARDMGCASSAPPASAPAVAKDAAKAEPAVVDGAAEKAADKSVTDSDDKASAAAADATPAQEQGDQPPLPNGQQDGQPSEAAAADILNEIAQDASAVAATEGQSGGQTSQAAGVTDRAAKSEEEVQQVAEQEMKGKQEAQKKEAEDEAAAATATPKAKKSTRKSVGKAGVVVAKQAAEEQAAEQTADQAADQAAKQELHAAREEARAHLQRSAEKHVQKRRSDQQQDVDLQDLDVEVDGGASMNAVPQHAPAESASSPIKKVRSRGWHPESPSHPQQKKGMSAEMSFEASAQDQKSEEQGEVQPDDDGHDPDL